MGVEVSIFYRGNQDFVFFFAIKCSVWNVENVHHLHALFWGLYVVFEWLPFLVDLKDDCIFTKSRFYQTFCQKLKPFGFFMFFDELAATDFVNSNRPNCKSYSLWWLTYQSPLLCSCPILGNHSYDLRPQWIPISCYHVEQC